MNANHLTQITKRSFAIGVIALGLFAGLMPWGAGRGMRANAKTAVAQAAASTVSFNFVAQVNTSNKYPSGTEGTGTITYDAAATGQLSADGLVASYNFSPSFPQHPMSLTFKLGTDTFTTSEGTISVRNTTGFDTLTIVGVFSGGTELNLEINSVSMLSSLALPTTLGFPAGNPLSGTFNLFQPSSTLSLTTLGDFFIPHPEWQPVITTTSLSRTAGVPAPIQQIATVSDDVDAPGSLVVTVANSTVNGVSISGLSVNSAGQVTAQVSASCTATDAAFTLRVRDQVGWFSETALNVAVVSNTPPTLGNYSDSTVALGGSATVTPDAAPADNISVSSLTASAPGFSGTLNANLATGAITVANANSTGSYTVSVTATDNCGVQTTKTFTLTGGAGNTPPTISGATISRSKGSTSAVSQIGTVGDANQSCASLSIAADPVSGSGVTLSGVSINAACQVLANVIIGCEATDSAFNLTVTDNQGATASSLLTFTLTNNTPPSFGTYPTTGPISVGASATVSPSVPLSDNGSITSLTVTAPGFAGTLLINSVTGAVTIGNASPAGNFLVSVTATDNCGAQVIKTFTLAVVANTCGITVNPATLPQAYLVRAYTATLSGSPADNYTFNVSAGALPPGLGVMTVYGTTSIVGIPTAPGTYNFTIKAVKNGTTCEATRSYTMTIPATVTPVLSCVQHNQNGSWTARFGYDNSTGAAVTIPVGANNYFTPGSQNRGQTTVFQPGRVTNAFSVNFTANGINLGYWFLKGPDGVLRPVNVLTTSIGCP